MFDSGVLSTKLAVIIAALWIATGTVAAQADPPGIPRWAAEVHRLSLKSPTPGRYGGAPGVFPPVIPRHFRIPDGSGMIGTENFDAPTVAASNPFFQILGTNGRACVTCHEPRSAWGVSAASIRQRFEASGGNDPIFRPVDGATCDSDPVATLAQKRSAYSLLLSRGVLRIFLPPPSTQLGSNPPAARDFEIVGVHDPYGCTDLSGSDPQVSVYRRPLPSANLRFLTECPSGNPSCSILSIMWDGREATLASQATDATLGHAQAIDGPSPEQLAAIVGFESNIYTAQEFDEDAGPLDARGATGGAEALSAQNFFIGINDSLSAGFNQVVFTLFEGWQNIAGSHGREAARGAVARGEALFNTRQFTITGVNGLNLASNDPLGSNPTTATCTTCHDSPNVGNHSNVMALAIGTADASPAAPLDVSGLPSFDVLCTGGPFSGQTLHVTDLGRAMISGRCADVGKFKGPILRGLAARAPYFHNGSAATLEDVVEFYDHRFSIGLTPQEKTDLAAFLKTL
jgi:cytochrome c peroxidase